MFTEEEKIEIFQSDLNKIIQDSELPISVVYLILNDCTNNIKYLYDNYRIQVGESITQKIKQQQTHKMEESDEAVE